jgi:hypothetical protein
LISAQDFNKITDIHEQKEIDPKHLKAIGAIFRAQHVEKNFGLQLLHRHYAISDGFIALTTPIDHSIVVTKVTPISSVDQSAIRGQLYLLNENGKFQAYEYEYGRPINFPEWVSGSAGQVYRGK